MLTPRPALWMVRLWMASLCCALGWLSLAAEAQVVPDGTLSTTVTSADGRSFVIGGGDRAGANLFHSLQEFSVPTRGSAFFSNAADVRNIITRVTGNSVSNIDGIIRANGSANLYLLNPNGIVFGENARLNIGGSFIGSTASAVRFADDVEFSTRETALLTVSTPTGLRLEANPGTIRINNQPTVSGVPDLTRLGLQLQTGQTLALIGGNIVTNGGRISLLNGQTILAGLAGAGTVGLEQTDNSFLLQMPSAGARANISIKNGSYLFSNALSPTPGFLVVGNRVTIADNSVIGSGILNFMPAGLSYGGVEIRASDRLFLDSGNVFAAVVEGGNGNIGDVTVETPNLVVTGGGRLATSSSGQGRVGNVNINAQNIRVDGIGSRLREGAATGIYSYNFETAIGNAGNVRINTENLSVVRGGQISASTAAQGNGGNVQIRASGSILVDGATPGRAGIASLISSSLEDDGRGNGGNISITTPFLRLSHGGGITGRVLGQGNGGNIRLQVNSLEAQTGGQVSTTSQRGGNAGNIWVNARDRISLSGQDDAYEARARRAGEFSRFGGASSGFYADTATQATGRGGNLTVSTPQLDLSDTALLSVSGRGAGGAGNLRLRANRITLNDQGQLTAEARSGDRGNINIQSNTVFLRNNSRITTTATETASGGDINVNAQFLVGLENSDVIARAQQGRGGNIAIAAQSVLGLQPRLELTPGNDINASSQLGLNGTVQISTPNIDANTGLVALPNDVIDSSQQIADRCGSAPTNQFIITGRGGVPASPSESRSERPWQDFRDLSAFTTAQTEQPVTSTASQPTDVWVEAIGFQHNAQGQVELVATSSGAEGDAGRIAIANSGSSFVQSSTCAASVGQ